MIKRRPEKSGMTLLEIIVALGLAAILTLVVMRLTEKQLAANKDFVLRNEIEMIRMEVVGLLQKDCRAMLAGLKITDDDNKKDEIEKKNISKLSLFYLQGPLDPDKAFDKKDYSEVPRYKGYATSKDALTDTAGSLWLRDVRLGFDKDNFQEIKVDNPKVKATIFLDFYRRLGSNHGTPAAGESNLTTMIPLTIVFKKNPSNTELLKAPPPDNNYVMSHCSCAGDTGISPQEIYSYICEKFLGGTPRPEGVSNNTACLNWHVDSEVTFNDTMTAKKANIDEATAHDTLCDDNKASGATCAIMHEVYDTLLASKSVGGNDAKIIAGKVKDKLNGAAAVDVQKMKECLAKRGDPTATCDVSWNGTKYTKPDELLKALQ